MLDPTHYETLLSSSVREPLARFALWLVEELRLERTVEGACCRVQLPEAAQHALDDREGVAFYLNGTAAEAAEEQQGGNSGADAVAPDRPTPSAEDHAPARRLSALEPFFQWLCRELAQRRVAANVRPCKDPHSVYQISERLFPQYQVDGGRVHLSGCTLEDRPFLRLTYPLRDTADEVLHLFFTQDGTPADAHSRSALGLAEICHREIPPPHTTEGQIELLVSAGKRLVHAHLDTVEAGDLGIVPEPLAAAVVWVKRAVGTLQFTIGEQSVSLAFDDWAGTLQAPPFVCPHTGRESFHVGATDDGRIAAAEAIEACAQTGRRVLAQDLVTCSVTSKRVLPELTRPCSITGLPALADQFDQCRQCRQQVSRIVVRAGVCEGCRKLAPVRSDDPRLIWILSEYPRLEAWKRWRLSETAGLYILVGSKLLRQVLLVCEKETLAPKYAATRGRLRKTWLPLDPTEEQDLFGDRPPL